MQEAQFWTIKQGKIQCHLCNHYCLIAENKTGICGVRQNIKGKLYSLIYGKLIAENVDPIAKKPLYHFLPGSTTYSIATVGCNFRCANCQNADISQFPIEQNIKFESFIPGRETKPEEVVKKAQNSGCASIAYTYTEPTIFAEFAIDCMKLAHKAGLKNVWVSNGYTAKEAWLKILPYLDAINVDLKFFNNETYLKICGAKLQPVLNNLILLKQNNIWLEVTTLLIPGLNDSKKEIKSIAEFIFTELGADTPWHISRFFPQYKMLKTDLTDEQKIYSVVEVAKEVGLKNVYAGNM